VIVRTRTKADALYYCKFMVTRKQKKRKRKNLQVGYKYGIRLFIAKDVRYISNKALAQKRKQNRNENNKDVHADLTAAQTKQNKRKIRNETKNGSERKRDERGRKKRKKDMVDGPDLALPCLVRLS
jgi:hypothetical protein